MPLSSAQASPTLNFWSQGNVEKVVVVIKDKRDVALERFVFAVQNMISVESYNKDTRFTRSHARDYVAY